VDQEREERTARDTDGSSTITRSEPARVSRLLVIATVVALLAPAVMSTAATPAPATPAPATSAAAPPDLKGAKTLHSGAWTKKTNVIAGTWAIVEKGGKRYVTLDEKFETRRAPDLKILLSPIEAKDLKSRNAMRKAVVVSLLKSPKGAQTYEIPARVKLDRYASIAIHCEKYTKLWGAAALEKKKKKK